MFAHAIASTAAIESAMRTIIGRTGPTIVSCSGSTIGDRAVLVSGYAAASRRAIVESSVLASATATPGFSRAMAPSAIEPR